MWLQHEPSLARRASRIHDPIERLRYLRASAGHRLARSRTPGYITAVTLVVLALVTGSVWPQNRLTQPSAEQAHLPRPAAVPAVWPVEKEPDFENYSNGLRVDTRYAVAHHPRSYLIFKDDAAERSSVPSGIVYHSTESDILPLNPAQTRNVLRTTSAVLHYVQEHRSYHFMIDRFGRVYQIVRESDSADHAGKSAWTAGGGICLNLNHAFLGIAFEARTEERLSSAQVHAGRMLTEALRSRFDIPAENCVTHAQVSVNASNMRIGWHTDWIKNFPFAQLGLSNNYERPLPSVTQLGFVSDPAYLDAAEPALALAIERSTGILRKAAEERGISPREWRGTLTARYRKQSSKE